ncbi:hypothetical protein SEA_NIEBRUSAYLOR_120 [Mycobacterium phage NiebruSaylor]|uniref:DUF7455 domain-containing protein n=4 Tax=Corndogvirus TaxID=1623285 RepID=A0A5P8DE07_BPMCO|nr:hypothetical protein PBI_CATDAWG_121 [Mycobacterium phage Catdawg]YP_010097615.1 hypothetical protein KNU03_gp125 [Mycobacterium phage Ryadel]AII28355.1 hypothetical protein PBI_YUNGJAMAL_116 [Mycobacterium phage YungJamal]ATW60604.1 hypothetical protein SEA_FAMILTON_122 [Mycobacterium phage Familton]AVI04149.1 hypothetical protein SEA_JANGDYNASTY_118 [Mycobacterium phage JangDynasty]AVP42776.1 hypothetical protein SEA_SCHOOLBUS_121 [Mycobacterium phage SchoolBus]AYQ98957.1 hypothetical pr
MDMNTLRLTRCDRCGAAAKFEVLVPSVASKLLFCGHHAKQHADAIGDRFPVLELAKETV